MSGMVWLVGGGCGQASFVTLRGKRCLERADVVVYDDLLDPDLLELASAEAERIYAGKRQGRHSMTQPEINALLVEKASQGKRICRLKGGDPFVFGRGGEEAEALRRAGVPFLIVPGISSAVAVPARAGIPVTHREISRSFHVITAHTAGTPDGLPQNLAALAALDGTLVFLMGLRQLPALSQGLMAAGMASDTPAAVIGNACVRETLASIAGRTQNMKPPAVILVGGTAGMDLYAGLPLSGVTVGLTGTAAFREKLALELEPFGAAVTTLQRSQVRPVCAPETLVQALDWLGDGWLGFTSPNGAAVFFALLAQAKWDLRRLGRRKVAAVGPSTADKLAEYGIYADLIASGHDVRSLCADLERMQGSDSVLLLRAEGAEHAPLNGRTLPLYALEAGPVDKTPVDYLVFGSQSGVKYYCSGGGLEPRRGAVCIGPRTAAAAARQFPRVLTAKDAATQAVAACILEDWSDQP